jgi:tetratricopeptide (TPR) repeat protein
MRELRLKSIQKDAVRSALDKAVWYRALHEPLEAESICRDVLEVDPDNQEALATLLLALTDQFSLGFQARYLEALEIAERFVTVYDQEYYAGIIFERRAKWHYQNRQPGFAACAYEGLTEAMTRYERAEQHRPPGNDDALLRWNTCARILMTHADIAPDSTERSGVEVERE